MRELAMRADAKNRYFSAEPARTQPARHRRGPRRCRTAARAGHLRDCGRKLAVFYRGPAKSVANYYCHSSAEFGRRPRMSPHECRWPSTRRRRRGVPRRCSAVALCLRDDPGCRQRLDLGCGVAGLGKHFLGVCAYARRRRRCRRRRTAEPRDRSRLLDPIDRAEHFSEDIVWMGDRFAHRQDRRDAGIATLEMPYPVSSAPTTELGGEPGPEFGPAGPLVLTGQIRPVEAEATEHLRVKLRLERAHCQVLVVRGEVGVVERCTAVEDVGPPLVQPGSLAPHTENHCHEGCAAVNHRRIDDLTPTGGRSFEQGGEYAEGDQHSAAAEVTDQIERRDGRLAPAADRTEHTGEGDVVDVMTGRRGERTLLAPTGHPAIHEPFVAPHHFDRTDPETLGHTRSERLDQHVRGRREGKYDL